MLSLLLFVSMCMVVYGETACEDILPNCQNLADKYCEAPYDKLAADVCARRCQLCSEESSDRIKKRVHGTPSWIDHCWSYATNDFQDPFCALLTTPVPTTNSNVVPTTPRTCYYVEHSDTDIMATDYRDILPTPTTFNENVRGDRDYCKTVCEEPVMNKVYECWAFTHSPNEWCHMYYYSKPIYISQMALMGQSNNTSLFLKRCNDPSTTVPTPTTPTRTCFYVEYNETDIKATDYATFNESVHLYGDSNYCKTVCEESVRNDGYECWGFKYNPTERCYLYYYYRPIYIIPTALMQKTSNSFLFLKRCNNDP